MLYYIDNLQQLTKSKYDKIFFALPLFRQDKASRYVKTCDKYLSAVSYQLLKYGLKQQFGIDEDVEFNYNDNGKPYLTNHDDIFFSISHTAECVAVGVSKMEIGVDVERVKYVDEVLINTVMNSDEVNQIKQSDDVSIEFCKLWTKKESLIKQRGGGINMNLKQILTNNSTSISTFTFDKLAISICGDEVESPTKVGIDKIVNLRK